MKKFILGLFVLVLLVAIAGGGGMYYIRPAQKLDLVYEEIPLKDRALDMARRLSTEMILTAADLNNLAKKSIAENPLVMKDIRVTGASFETKGDLLLANLNIIWKETIPANLTATYRLRWNEPNVVATVVEARIKELLLSDALFPERIIPIGNELPKLLKIKELIWGEGEIRVQFEAPSWEDVRELL